EMNRIGVHFEFFSPITNSSPWTWTSLMGPDKLKVLQSFQISKFFKLNRGREIECLWHKFYRLYKVMHQQNLNDIEIDKFEDDVKQWIRNFTQPTVGKLNSPNQQQGMYPKKKCNTIHAYAGSTYA
ncbi:29130_t:CDS:1, partial [Racocetra persica]